MKSLAKVLILTLLLLSAGCATLKGPEKQPTRLGATPTHYWYYDNYFVGPVYLMDDTNNSLSTRIALVFTVTSNSLAELTNGVNAIAAATNYLAHIWDHTNVFVGPVYLSDNTNVTLGTRIGLAITNSANATNAVANYVNKTNNLSDLTNIPKARTNLGIGAIDSLSTNNSGTFKSYLDGIYDPTGGSALARSAIESNTYLRSVDYLYEAAITNSFDLANPFSNPPAWCADGVIGEGPSAHWNSTGGYIEVMSYEAEVNLQYTPPSVSSNVWIFTFNHTNLVSGATPAGTTAWVVFNQNGAHNKGEQFTWDMTTSGTETFGVTNCIDWIQFSFPDSQTYGSTQIITWVSITPALQKVTAARHTNELEWWWSHFATNPVVFQDVLAQRVFLTTSDTNSWIAAQTNTVGLVTQMVFRINGTNLCLAPN